MYIKWIQICDCFSLTVPSCSSFLAPVWLVAPCFCFLAIVLCLPFSHLGNSLCHFLVLDLPLPGTNYYLLLFVCLFGGVHSVEVSWGKFEGLFINFCCVTIHPKTWWLKTIVCSILWTQLLWFFRSTRSEL